VNGPGWTVRGAEVLTAVAPAPGAAGAPEAPLPPTGPVPPPRPEVGRRSRVWTTGAYGAALVVVASVTTFAAPRSSWWWIYGLACQLLGCSTLVVAFVRFRRERFDSKVRAIALQLAGGATSKAPVRPGAGLSGPAAGPARVRKIGFARRRAGSVAVEPQPSVLRGRLNAAFERAARKATRGEPGQPANLGVSQLRVIRSEWTKLHSLRSTKIAMFVMMLIVVGVAVLVASVVTSQWDKLDSVGREQFNPALAPLAGVGFAALVGGVLGVLTISGEYGTGMIRSSLTAVPRRLQWLVGKFLTLTLAVWFVGLASTLAAFWLAQALLSRKGLGVTSGAPHAGYFVVAAAGYLVLVAALGMGLGAVLRHTAAAISALFGLFLVLPIVVNLLPANLSGRLAPLLPAAAGQTFWTHGAESNGATGSPWVALLIVLGWAGGLVTLGAMRLVNEDV